MGYQLLATVSMFSEIMFKITGMEAKTKYLDIQNYLRVCVIYASDP